MTCCASFVQALSMGVHESQSLLWERMVALGRPFAAYLLPLMREYFPSVSRADLNCLRVFWVG